jgi:hypothetical protein
MHRLEFVSHPREFLAVARPLLARDPVVSTVVASFAELDAAHFEAGEELPEDRPYWWLVVRDADGEPVSAGMRTAPFEPWPVFLLPMPEDAAQQLARELYVRGEAVDGANGFRPATDAFAAEAATLTHRTPRVNVHMRLFELETLVPPAPVPGRLRLAREDEVDLCVTWYDAFAAAADEQAGRPAGALHEGKHDRDQMLRRIKEERVCLWVDPDDRPLHVTGFNLPAFGVSRIGPVYTPVEHRGRGLASNAVAEVSRWLLEAGARPCLYTDQDNPVSNRIYQALGCRAVVDQVNYVLE